MLGLPAELQRCCAAALDARSAGRFSQCSKTCALLVEEQLIEAGQRFIDAHLVEFINAAPAARQELAQRIFEEAKTREVELNAILWTVKSVKTRLHNALKLGNAADAAVPALNQH